MIDPIPEYFNDNISSCDSNACLTCNSFISGQSFKSYLTGRIYKTQTYEQLTCGSSNVVYAIHCIRCCLISSWSILVSAAECYCSDSKHIGTNKIRAKLDRHFEHNKFCAESLRQLKGIGNATFLSICLVAQSLVRIDSLRSVKLSDVSSKLRNRKSYPSIGIHENLPFKQFICE